MKDGRKSEYVTYMKNQINELINNYDTDIMWFDSDWVDWWTMEDGRDMYQYIRSLKPSILINNRVAKRSEFKKDFGTPEQEHPGDAQDHYWEACYTMNESWGYKSEDKEWKSADNILNKLNEINSNGGNLLLNIGPDGKGTVPNRICHYTKGIRKKTWKIALCVFLMNSYIEAIFYINNINIKKLNVKKWYPM